MEAIVDRDIVPREKLIGSLPDTWEVATGMSSTVAQVQSELDGVNVAFVTSRIPLPRSVLENASDIEIIAKLGTGIDNVDCTAAQELGITVTHTPGHNALSVAEHTVCLVLATTHRLTEARNLLERGAWRDEFSLASRFSGSTVGIIGLGNVGKRVGTMLSGFDVEILATDPYIHEIDAELVNGTLTALPTLLEQSDVVVVTTELTDETRDLIGRRELSLMAQDAIIVNTARGPVIEEEALLDALESGEIGGAGLDVYENEPLDPESPLLDLENVVLTPHVAAMTMESRTEGIERLTTNVKRLVEGTSIPDHYLAVPDE